jgi:hypothetical protein
MGFDQDLTEVTYPDHLRDFTPIFEINPKKELEIMANKYRIQAEESLSKFNKLTSSFSSSGPIKISPQLNKIMS